ncbi:hypothetical protein THAOC_12155, partial [Thalassiosira oceanica]
VGRNSGSGAVTTAPDKDQTVPYKQEAVRLKDKLTSAICPRLDVNPSRALGESPPSYKNACHVRRRGQRNRKRERKTIYLEP